MTPLTTELLSEARVALRTYRHHSAEDHYVNSSLWLPLTRRDGTNQCRICGDHVGRLVWDHCHVTGLTRGLICQSCNVLEPLRHGHPIFDAWRLCAPDLAIGGRNIQGHEGRSRGLTDEQLLTMPMPELLALAQSPAA